MPATLGTELQVPLLEEKEWIKDFPKAISRGEGVILVGTFVFSAPTAMSEQSMWSFICLPEGTRTDLQSCSSPHLPSHSFLVFLVQFITLSTSSISLQGSGKLGAVLGLLTQELEALRERFLPKHCSEIHRELLSDLKQDSPTDPGTCQVCPWEALQPVWIALSQSMSEAVQHKGRMCPFLGLERGAAESSMNCCPCSLWLAAEHKVKIALGQETFPQWNSQWDCAPLAFLCAPEHLKGAVPAG